MTDREIMQQALEALEFFWNAGYRNIAEQQKTLITALRDRLAQPEQEPVGKIGWAANRPNTICVVHWIDMPPVGTNLYTAPPQRKPLTLQERTKIVRANKTYHDKDEIDAYGVIDDVEAAHGIKENT